MVHGLARFRISGVHWVKASCFSSVYEIWFGLSFKFCLGFCLFKDSVLDWHDSPEF